MAASLGVLHSIQEAVGHNYSHNCTPNAIFFNSTDIFTDDLEVMVGKTVGPLTQIKAVAPHCAHSHSAILCCHTLTVRARKASSHKNIF